MLQYSTVVGKQQYSIPLATVFYYGICSGQWNLFDEQHHYYSTVLPVSTIVVVSKSLKLRVLPYCLYRTGAVATDTYRFFSLLQNNRNGPTSTVLQYSTVRTIRPKDMGNSRFWLNVSEYDRKGKLTEQYSKYWVGTRVLYLWMGCTVRHKLNHYCTRSTSVRCRDPMESSRRVNQFSFDCPFLQHYSYYCTVRTGYVDDPEMFCNTVLVLIKTVTVQ